MAVKQPNKRSGLRQGVTKDAPSQVEIARRRERVATLLAAHTSRQRISELIGVSLSVVDRDVAAIKADSRERAGATMDQHLADELARLDELGRRLWNGPLSSNPISLTALDRALRLYAQRCRLLGLDKPQQIEVTGAGGQPLIPVRDDEALLSEIDRLTERLANIPDRLHEPQ